jgi:malonate transporter and related proteins
VTGLAAIVLPIFGIMALGALAVKLRVLNPGGVYGLVLFVFNFAIPILLFRSLAVMELPEDIRWSFLLSFYGGSFAVFAAGMAAGKVLFGRVLADQGIFGMGAGFSNTVLMGLPILFTAFGPDATLPTLLIIAFHGPLLMSLTVAVILTGRGGGVSLRRMVRIIGLDLVRNPIIMGLLLGVAVNLGGMELPGPVDTMAEMVGASAVPCALFALGASLAGYPLIGDVPPALVLTVIKVVVHPALVWILAVPILGLEGIWVKVAVVMAAMPSGINVYLFGARYDVAPGVAARTVLLSTVASLVTIPVFLYLLTGR